MVEIDETYVGGKEANKHANFKLNRGRGAVGKQAVLGMRERGGQTKAMHIPNADLPTIQQAIHDHVEVGSQILIGYLFCDDPLPFIAIGLVMVGVGILWRRRI